MTCKGICIQYKTTGNASEGLYKNGNKRCQICDIFIKWDGIHCPCCGQKLRTGPRRKQLKEKLRDFKESKK